MGPSTGTQTSPPTLRTAGGACLSAASSTAQAMCSTSCLLPRVSPAPPALAAAWAVRIGHTAVRLNAVLHSSCSCSALPLSSTDLRAWPAGESYPALTPSTRKSAGYCYDTTTLLPQYNPLAVSIPAEVNVTSNVVVVSPLSTVLVFGSAFGAPRSWQLLCHGLRWAWLALLCGAQCLPAYQLADRLTSCAQG